MLSEGTTLPVRACVRACVRAVCRMVLGWAAISYTAPGGLQTELSLVRDALNVGLIQQQFPPALQAVVAVLWFVVK